MSRKITVFFIILTAFVTIAATIGFVVIKQNNQQQLLNLQRQLALMSEAVQQQQDELAQQQQQLEQAQKNYASEKERADRLQRDIDTMRAQNADKKICFLTFDDGPSKNTLKILDILDRYNIKATFFVIGRGKTEYMKDIVDAGHAIGLHSYSHEFSQIYQSETAYFEDLQKLSDLVRETTGVTTTLMRFPGGSSNTASKKYCNGIMTALTKSVEQKGYAYFDWNCDSHDADGATVPASQIINSIKRESGAQHLTVLMHDAGAKTSTVEALPAVIEYLQQQGYSFQKLNKIVKPYHHSINN